MRASTWEKKTSSIAVDRTLSCSFELFAVLAYLLDGWIAAP